MSTIIDSLGYIARTANNREVRGWKQHLLDGGKAVIIGDDTLAYSVLKSLAGLGYGIGREGGSIKLHATTKHSDRPLFLSPVQDSHPFFRRRGVGKLSEVNPYISASVTQDLSEALHADADVYLLLGNDISVKEQVLQEVRRDKDRYAGKTFISASSSREDASIIVARTPDLVGGILLQEFDGHQQYSLTSGYLTPLILEEMRRHHFTLNKEFFDEFQGKTRQERDYGLEERLNISRFSGRLHSSGRFKGFSTTELFPRTDSLRLLFAGAGGVGFFDMYNTLLDTLELLPQIRQIEIEVYDPDVIEERNLYAQVIYYGYGNGEKEGFKAEVIAERLRRDPQIQIHPHREPVTYEKLVAAGKRYDAIHSNVDENQATRELLQYALASGTPWIRGSITSDCAYSTLSVPGGKVPSIPVTEKAHVNDGGCGGIHITPRTIMMNEFAGVNNANMQMMLAGGISPPYISCSYESRSLQAGKICTT